MATKSQKIVASGILFGAIHAISSYFFFLSEPGIDYSTVLMVAGGFLLICSLLGVGIAYIVVKQSQNWKFVLVMTILSLGTFIPSMFVPNILA